MLPRAFPKAVVIGAIPQPRKQAYIGANPGNGSDLLPLLLLQAQGRQHGPVGNVIRGIGQPPGHINPGQIRRYRPLPAVQKSVKSGTVSIPESNAPSAIQGLNFPYFCVCIIHNPRPIIGSFNASKIRAQRTIAVIHQSVDVGSSIMSVR